MYHSLFLIFTLTIQLTCSTFNILKIVNGFILGKKMSSLSKLVKPILPTSLKYLFFFCLDLLRADFFGSLLDSIFFFFFYLFSLFFLITSSFLFPSNNLIFYLSFFESCFNLNRLFHMH